MPLEVDYLMPEAINDCGIVIRFHVIWQVRSGFQVEPHQRAHELQASNLSL